MKKIFVFSVVCFSVITLNAQNNFDEKTGEQILTLLPAKMKDKGIKKENDRVKNAKGFLGWYCHRDYGDYQQNVKVECINNSPSLVSVNNFLNNPTNNPNYLITTIDGRKALVQTLIFENGTINYELLIPMSTTLLSVRTIGYSRDDLIALANTIPVSKIASLVE